MHTAIPCAWVLAAAGMAFTAELPKGRTVEVDGYSVKVGKRTELGGQIVETTVDAYEAEIAGRPAVLLSGYAVSRLPTEYFKVTLTIACWDVYPETKAVFKRAVGKVQLTTPKPNLRTKWATVATYEAAEGAFQPFAKPKPVYAVSVQVEPYVPRKQGKAGTTDAGEKP